MMNTELDRVTLFIIEHFLLIVIIAVIIGVIFKWIQNEKNNKI